MTKPLMWRTKEGIDIRVSDMGDDHLLNSIGLVHRTHQKRCLARAIGAGRYSMTASDGAADAAEQAEREFLDLADEDTDIAVAAVTPIYEALLREAHRRKLGVSIRGLDDGSVDEFGQ